jgi:hypothetical protein
MLADTYAVLLTQSSPKIYRYEQLSNSPGGKTRREAILGETVFQANLLTKFLPFLTAGGLLNVNSNKSAGFGRFIMKRNCK